MEKFFRKEFSGYEEAQVRALFRHAQAIYEVWHKAAICQFPEPISCEERGITYRYIELPASISDRLNAGTCPETILHFAGAALAALHQQTENNLTLLHGDFVPHNVFGDINNFWVIDAHPPELLGYRDTLLYGLPERDLTAFLYCLFSNAGLRAIGARPNYYFAMARAFRKGYETLLPWPGFFAGEIARYARDVYVMKRRAGIGAPRALWHAAGYALLTLMALGISR